MQASAVKTSSSAHSHIQGKRKPFFKNGKGNFFSKSNKTTPAFFNANPIQRKLTIGKPNDIYEKEADAMADQVVQRLSADSSEVLTKDQNLIQAKTIASFANITPFVQTKCASCGQEEKLQKKEDDGVENTEWELQKAFFDSNDDSSDNNSKTGVENIHNHVQRKCAACEHEDKLQKKAIFESNEEHATGEGIQRKCSACEEKDHLQAKAGVSAQPALPNIENSLSSPKGSGSALPLATRSQMENSFGADFSKVRIHDNSSSIQMNKDLNTQAFSHGSDIYFNSGKYDTTSNAGKHLLAHELTHVVQQSGGTEKKIQKQEDSSASYYIREITDDTYRETISARIAELEIYAESAHISEVSERAISLLRELFEQGRIQVWETRPTDAAASFSREPPQHTIRIHSVCSLPGEDCNPPLISTTILLHEAIHALHQSEHPGIDVLYHRYGRGRLRGAQLIRYLRYRVWTEYYARAEVILYQRHEFHQPLNDEDYRDIMRNQEMRNLIHELRESLPGDERSDAIDPRGWDASEFN